MEEIKNPTGMDAIIVFTGNEGDICCVFPDTVHKDRRKTMQWVVAPPNNATVSFKTKSPFDWKSMSGSVITGTIRKDAELIDYKYSVTDDNGNTIDPQIRVRR